jgi:DNA-binding transcriptional LysR family regulator
MPNSLATTIGPQVIRFLRDLADEMLIDSGFAATRYQALSRREFDFLVTPDESTPPPDIDTIPFMTEPLLVVAPKSYAGNIQNLGQLGRDLDYISFGRDQHLASRLSRAFRDVGITLQRRYHLDTNEAVLQMVAAGAGWTVLSALAVIRFIERSEPIQVALYPEANITRTLVVAFRRGEGEHLAQKIHDAAIESLADSILPVVSEKLGQEIARRIILHDAPQTRI